MDDFPVGTTTVTYTATDDAGNTTTASFDITVTDSEAPSIAGMPADISLSNDASACAAIATWTAPTSDDNCGVTSFTSTHNSGDSFPVGMTTVTYSATDAAGNTTTASFTVTVMDGENPTIAGMPADINLSNDAGVCGAATSWTAPTYEQLRRGQLHLNAHQRLHLRSGHHDGDLHGHGRCRKHGDGLLQCGGDR